MKHFKYAVLAILIICASCGKDDDEPINSKLLVGEWDLVNYNYESTSKLNFLGVSFESSDIGETIETDYQVTFSENPNNYSSKGNYRLRSITDYDGEKEESEFSESDLLKKGTWELIGKNRLMYKNSNGGFDGETLPKEGEMIVEKLSAQELILSIDQDFKELGADVKVKAKMTFTRK